MFADLFVDGGAIQYRGIQVKAHYFHCCRSHNHDPHYDPQQEKSERKQWERDA